MDEDQEEEQKFIVNGEEAKEQLTRKILEREKEQARQHLRKVLPLHKSRHHNRHRKHSKHSSRKTGRREE